MEVRPGYKRTEVGVVPEDWETSKIGDFAFVTKLAGFEYTLHFDYSKSGPVIAVRALNIKNGTLDLTEVHTIPRKTSDELPRSKLVKGDLVISYVGTLGRVAIIPEDNKFHLAPNVAKICVDQEHVAPEFLAQFLNSFVGQKLIFDAAASTTQAALSMGNLRDIVFTRPPLPEQRAIAAALSDVDALLAGLDRLIAKKRDLKQAAMQQLLTDQSRLPGFHGEWEVKRLADMAWTLKGRGLSKAHLSRSGGRPCILYGELFTKYGRKISVVDSRSNSTEGLPSVAGDVLMPGSTTTSGIDLATASALLVDGVALGGDINVIRRRRDAYDPSFLANYLTVVARRQIEEMSQGITIHHLYGKDLLSLSLRLPPLDEQIAISTVLSDMDTELSALEARRNKTRALKHGMLQELLSGRTRMV